MNQGRCRFHWVVGRTRSSAQRAFREAERLSKTTITNCNNPETFLLQLGWGMGPRAIEELPEATPELSASLFHLVWSG